MSGGAALDDAARIRDLDRSDMLSHVAALGYQLRRSYEAARAAEDLPSGDGVRSIVVCGMGGSGLSGDVVRSLYASRSQVPIVVSKGYSLPEFCGHDTFVIAASFSGDTEETLAAYEEAVQRGCRVVAVSAGGELAARSSAEGVPHVAIPGDVPVPRAALGDLAGAPVGILEAAELIPSATSSVIAAARLLDAVAERLAPAVPAAENEAKQLASWIGRRTPLIWASEDLGAAAALRWKNQMNENAKVPAFHAVLPELDHNDVEGWSEGTGQGYALVVLRQPGERHGLAARIDATLDAIAPSGLDVREARGEGRTEIERLFSLMMLGDFVSTYLALERGLDPTPVPVLTGLKDRLRA